MAITLPYTANDGEIPTGANFMANFNQLNNNPIDFWSPATKAVDMNGFELILDADADTSVTADTDDQIDFRVGAEDVLSILEDGRYRFTPQALSGTPATSTGGYLNMAAATFTDNATAGSGTATAWAAHAIQRPTLAATNTSVTTTDAAVLYIANNVAAGTNQTLTNSWALWIAGTAGTATLVRLDGALVLNPYGTSAGNTGELRLRELAANGTNYVGFKSGDTLAGNVIWTLPTADAAGVFSSNGTGTVTLQAVATQADMETATSVLAPVTPGRQHYHLGHPKGAGQLATAGGINWSYGIASIADTSTGVVTVTWSNTFANTDSMVPQVSTLNSSELIPSVSALTSTTVTAFRSANTAGTPTDPTVWFVSILGNI